MKHTHPFKRKTCTCLLGLSLLCAVPAPSLMAQEKTAVTLNVRNERITNVFNQITRQSGYKFFYDEELVNSTYEVTLKFRNASLEDILRELSRQTGLSFVRNNKTITVGKKENTTDRKGKTIQGTVIDASGEPIIGATVQVKGTQLGAITDMEGRYTLRNVPDGATLSFSYIGFQSQDIRASDTRALARVELKEDAELLDEVVVLGYGNIRRSDVTGSIASVSAETLSKVASSSIADAIAGKMAGVQVTTADGALDAEISVRVRGGGSITQDNSPLYLVDGFPVDDLSGIPLTDIESIDVLKEASMTAIYGARGANGVVIITTKNPKIGKTSIQFNSYVQTRTLAKKLPVMDNYEFVMADYEYEMIRKGSD